jgi:hypothetical protein
MEVVNARQLLVYSSHEPRIRFVDLARALGAGEWGRQEWRGGENGEEGGKKRKGKKKKRMRGLKKVLVCV